MTTCLPSIKNVHTPLVKSVLMPFELTVEASATDRAIQNDFFGSGMIKLISTNEELDHIINIVKFLEGACLLIKVVSETVKNEVKEQKVNF